MNSHAQLIVLSSVIYNFYIVHSSDPWWKYYGCEHSYQITFLNFFNTMTAEAPVTQSPDHQQPWYYLCRINVSLSPQLNCEEFFIHRHLRASFLSLPQDVTYHETDTWREDGKSTAGGMTLIWHQKWDTSLWPFWLIWPVHISLTNFLILTPLPLVLHICVSESGQHWFR